MTGIEINKCLIKFLLFSFVMISCGEKNSAGQIIKKSIEAHGGNYWKRSEISFVFRSGTYYIFNRDGEFRYRHTYRDTSGNTYKSILDNSGFQHFINDQLQALTDSMRNKLESRLNSVVYFAIIPFKLDDKAVIAEYLGESDIKGKKYYKIAVRFHEEGGGNDYQDRFIYWIEQEHYLVDYLAYTFHVNGGGSRFRKRVNSRVINGIYLSDYENYKATNSAKIKIEEYESLLEKSKLIKVSDIQIKEATVRYLE